MESTRDPAHEMEALRLVRTRDGAHYLEDDSGPWRTYHFVANTVSFDLCQGSDQAYKAARAFGVFQARLLDLPARELRETLPSFFSTPFRSRSRMSSPAMITSRRRRTRASSSLTT